MTAATTLTGIRQEARAWKTRSEPCAVLAEKTHIPAKCRVQALPDDFVPGGSLYSTVEKIRLAYSNYDQLLAELLLACRDHALAGRKCALSQDSDLAPHWWRCPLLSPLRCELRRIADDRAEHAFANWCERTGLETSAA